MGAWVSIFLLLYVIYTDLSDLRIPNVVVMALLAVFAATQAPFLPLPELAWRTGAAAVVFALGVAVFVLHLLGGGDVKLLPVVVLFIPSGQWAQFMLALSVAVILSLSCLRLLRRTGVGRQWRSLNQTARYPLGPAIALAALIYEPLGVAVMSALSG